MSALKPLDFQEATANRILELYQQKQYRVLLADEVGLGKTIIASAVIQKVGICMLLGMTISRSSIFAPISTSQIRTAGSWAYRKRTALIFRRVVCRCSTFASMRAQGEITVTCS